MRPSPHRAAARLYVPSSLFRCVCLLRPSPQQSNCTALRHVRFADCASALLSLRKHLFLQNFFSNFWHFFFILPGRARKYPAALGENEREGQLLQPRPRRIPKKKGACCDPNTSSSSLCTLVNLLQNVATRREKCGYGRRNGPLPACEIGAPAEQHRDYPHLHFGTPSSL